MAGVVYYRALGGLEMKVKLSSTVPLLTLVNTTFHEPSASLRQAKVGKFDMLKPIAKDDIFKNIITYRKVITVLRTIAFTLEIMLVQRLIRLQ